MKLKKFNQLIAEKDKFDDEFYNDLDNAGLDPLEHDLVDEEDIDDVESEDVAADDILENLLSTLRKMIKPSFDISYVFTDDEGTINIQIVLNKHEKIGRVMKAMNLFKKLENDILIQYESEFDLWETKEGDPLLTAKFFYDEDVTSTNDAPPF
jgi:hypothetical protein